MRVFFEPVWKFDGLRRALQSDGWAVQAGQDGSLLGEHPRVADEAAARSRLYRLGLLTSGRLRIEFQHGG